MENPFWAGEAAFYWWGEATSGLAHEGAPWLQVQVCFPYVGVGVGRCGRDGLYDPELGFYNFRNAKKGSYDIADFIIIQFF